MKLLEVKNLEKIYTTRFGGQQVQALKDITFSVDQGEYIAIMGESGSGKTTLLNIIASLDQPTNGKIYLNEQNIVDIEEENLAKYRREHLGFVFQDFNLLDTLSVMDNIFLPLVLSGESYEEMKPKLDPIVESLGIDHLISKLPYEISGGEQQRTAIARGLITKPDLLLADEPTGELDSKSSKQLLNVFSEINQNGRTILMVTHSVMAASHATRVLFIKDGKIFHQLHRGELSNQEMFEKISNTLTLIASGGKPDAE